jgi:hypothetical protein
MWSGLLQCGAGALLGFLPALVLAPDVRAGAGWVAVAGSPSRESLDWAYGPDRFTAKSNALAQCARLQNANNCVVLASSPACAAVAWDVSEPLNRAFGAMGFTTQEAVQAAMSAAGPYANDPSVRCTWFANQP